MKKYSVYFCDCGRVHFVENEKINNAIHNGKEVLIVCNNCGTSFVIGANKGLSFDDDNEECYFIYNRNLRDTVIDDTSNISNIVFTSGEKIIMMTGKEATYHGNVFVDWETPKPEGVSEEAWDIKRREVNIESTIKVINDEEKIDEMSHYASGIDWTGTKYDIFSK